MFLFNNVCTHLDQLLTAILHTFLLDKYENHTTPRRVKLFFVHTQQGDRDKNDKPKSKKLFVEEYTARLNEVSTRCKMMYGIYGERDKDRCFIVSYRVH